MWVNFWIMCEILHYWWTFELWGNFWMMAELLNCVWAFELWVNFWLIGKLLMDSPSWGANWLKGLKTGWTAVPAWRVSNITWVTHTHTRTSGLYDWIGPEGLFSENMWLITNNGSQTIGNSLDLSHNLYFFQN